MSLRLKIILAAAAVMAAACVYYAYDPSVAAFFPKCALKQLTGFDCPGCGSQRAIHALLHADVASAWRHNALLVASIPFVALLLVAEILRTRCPRFYAAVTSPVIIWIVFAVVVMWWIGRNLW